MQQKRREYKKKDKTKEGAGILDALKDPIGTIKNAFSGPPTKLNNISTKTLNEYGNKPIFLLKIARTPLNSALNTAVNVLSLGKFEELKKKYGYDTLYHLSLIATLPGNVEIIIEKNESITIEPLARSSSIKPNTEYKDVTGLQPALTLNTLIDKGMKYLGNKFFTYDALTNNCQNFISGILDANGLLTPQLNTFIFQDMTNINKDLNTSGFSYVPKVMRKITDLGNIASRLLGKGKKNKDEALKDFDKYLEKYNIDTRDEKLITEHFLDFINSEGIKFI